MPLGVSISAGAMYGAGNTDVIRQRYLPRMVRALPGKPGSLNEKHSYAAHMQYGIFRLRTLQTGPSIVLAVGQIVKSGPVRCYPFGHRIISFNFNYIAHYSIDYRNCYSVLCVFRAPLKYRHQIFMTQLPIDSASIDPPTASIDETLDMAGNAKPGWQPVLQQLYALNSDNILSRQNEISRQLRTTGIAYNAVSHKSVDDRPWKLDLIPLVIESSDWSVLSDGLVQRAQVKRLLLQDLYGEQRILREGVIPPGAVFAHEGFLRVAQQLPGVNEFPICSADVSRSPSGDWHVVDDICQAPTGIGYALENRIVLSQAIPLVFRDNPVKRLAAYFRSLQYHLAQSTRDDERCVILAYGSTHPYYFEYAYLAKYLGYTLVEINDLTVRDERVYLKTVSGLQRVDVILRFIHDKNTDPLAVSNSQSVGIPGMLQAVYSGNIKIYNPLGVAVLENPAFNAYLNEISRFYLGEDAKLLSTPTYWLGDQKQRAAADSRRDLLLYRDINTVGSLLDPVTMSDSERSELFSKLDALPERYVAQERVDRSHAPSWIGEEQLQKQLTTRCYLIDNDGDYKVMDGGLCLLDSTLNGGRPARYLLEGSKDVWVLDASNRPYDTTVQTNVSESKQISFVDGELPSRVADNLFWLGRYAEKTENTIRVLHTALKEYLGDEIHSTRSEITDIPASIAVLLKTLTKVTGSSPGFSGKTNQKRITNPWRDLRQLLIDENRYGSLASTIGNVRRVSNQLRDRLSPELMRVLNDLDDNQKQLQQMVSAADHKMLPTDTVLLAAINERFEAMLITMAAFTGLVHENLTHGDNWRFLMLAKRIERANLSAGIVRTFMQHEVRNSQLLEVLLRLFDSMITYRTRYRSQLNAVLVMHLLLLDEKNPKSLAYQFSEIDSYVRHLPGKHNSDYRDPLLRLATVGLSRVRLANIESLLNSSSTRQTADEFLKVLEDIPTELSSTLTATYFTHTEVQRSLVHTTLLQPDTDVPKESLLPNGADFSL